VYTLGSCITITPVLSESIFEKSIYLPISDTESFRQTLFIYLFFFIIVQRCATGRRNLIGRYFRGTITATVGHTVRDDGGGRTAADCYVRVLFFRRVSAYVSFRFLFYITCPTRVFNRFVSAFSDRRRRRILSETSVVAQFCRRPIFSRSRILSSAAVAVRIVEAADVWKRKNSWSVYIVHVMFNLYPVFLPRVTPTTPIAYASLNFNKLLFIVKLILKSNLNI